MKTDVKTATAALNIVKAAANARHSVKALGAVKITGAAGVATMEATNMELAARSIFAADDVTDMVSLVNVAQLAKALSVMKGAVTFTQGDGAGLVVTSGARTVNLPGERIEDFYQTPYSPGVTIIDASGADLANAITRAAPFASKDETRPVLTGIAIDARGSLVATNSYFLGVIPCPGVDGAAVTRCGTRDMLNVPASAWQLAAKTMKGVDRVKVTYDAMRVTIETGDTTWSARVIDGTFPHWDALMPEESAFTAVATMSGAETMRESASAAVKLLDTNAPLRVSLNGGLTVTARGRDGLNMSETVPASITYAGADVGGDKWSGEFGVSPNYLADAMKALEGGAVTLSLIAPKRPLLVSSDAGRALLMPIRLDI